MKEHCPEEPKRIQPLKGGLLSKTFSITAFISIIKINLSLTLSKLNEVLITAKKMTPSHKKKARRLLFLFSILVSFCLLYACSRQSEYRYYGYAEGEFVFVAPAFAGHLFKLEVERGEWVEAKQPLFFLDAENEFYAKEKSEEELKAFEAQLADLIKPSKRPDEIAALTAQLEQAKAQFAFSEIQLQRNKKLLAVAGISQELLDENQSQYDRNKAHVQELEDNIRVGLLSAREDQIQKAKDDVEAALAALGQAKWKLGKKSVYAPAHGRIQDTLYRQGEWVGEGMPVVMLLPPENVKARFFVPEKDLGRIKIGHPVSLECDSCEKSILAKITFVSQQAEFTLPIIFSQDSREKLVYLIEASVPSEEALRLHPGQPLTIILKNL
jgi:HlyD family secretion protein